MQIHVPALLAILLFKKNLKVIIANQDVIQV